MRPETTTKKKLKTTASPVAGSERWNAGTIQSASDSPTIPVSTNGVGRSRSVREVSRMDVLRVGRSRASAAAMMGSARRTAEIPPAVTAPAPT